jgi:nitric oxide reductase activation protein
MYPEWDTFQNRYRQNHCQVVEYDTDLSSSDPVPPPDAVHALRRRLARISRSLERHRRQESGGELDLDSLVDMTVSAAAGRAVDARVYEARRRTAPNLAVALLLDASGSTGEGRADGSRVYDQQRRVLANLASALEDLGYRVTVYAFHSNGEKNVRMIRIKTFDDRFDQAARARLGALGPSGFTRMGTAIRHAAELLRRGAGIERQLIVMLSDGFPYDHGGYEGTYAEADTRRALVEARGRGIACACLNFAPPEEDNRLDRIFKGSAHLRVGDINPEFPAQVASLFTDALRAIAIESPCPPGT